MEFQSEEYRIYATDDSGKLLAEITFPIDAHGAYEINHTFVDSSLRGKGIADQLMRAAVEQITRAGAKIVPTCSYARKWFEKHPEQNGTLA